MISWLMILCLDGNSDSNDTVLGPGTAVMNGTDYSIEWDGKTASLTDLDGLLSRQIPPKTFSAGAHSYAIVSGQIDEPVPAKLLKLRLPGSQAPAGILLVQDGSFRGCYFTVSAEPCWLGQGAHATMRSSKTLSLYTGSSPLQVGDQEYPAETSVNLENKDIVYVGRRRFQYVALPSKEMDGASR